MVVAVVVVVELGAQPLKVSLLPTSFELQLVGMQVGMQYARQGGRHLPSAVYVQVDLRR